MARLLPPESAAVDRVAHELGIGIATLKRWRAEAPGGSENGADLDGHGPPGSRHCDGRAG